MTHYLTVRKCDILKINDKKCLINLIKYGDILLCCITIIYELFSIFKFVIIDSFLNNWS